MSSQTYFIIIILDKTLNEKYYDIVRNIVHIRHSIMSDSTVLTYLTYLSYEQFKHGVIIPDSLDPISLVEDQASLSEQRKAKLDFPAFLYYNTYRKLQQQN